jgi:hypothetical protein
MAYHWIVIWVARRGNEMVFDGVRASQSLVFCILITILESSNFSFGYMSAFTLTARENPEVRV